MTQDKIDVIIDEAMAAHSAAALRVWARDEFEDRGSCGGYILALDSRTRVAKRLVERKLGYRLTPGICVGFRLPDEIRSQNADIPEAAGRAAKAVFEAHGVRISEARSYTD